MKRNAMAGWVLGLIVTGCGGAGGGGGAFGSFNNGIVSQQAGASCQGVARQGGWSDGKAALHAGTTGDACSFQGAVFDLQAPWLAASCIQNSLIVQTNTISYPSSGFCAFNPATEAPEPIREGDCVRHCFDQPGDALTCVVGSGQPTRTLSEPWLLSSAADCQAIYDGCPQVGDPCSGDVVCRGKLPITPNSHNYVLAWCVRGALQLADDASY
jgi:hypothetical protein